VYGWVWAFVKTGNGKGVGLAFVVPRSPSARDRRRHFMPGFQPSVLVGLITQGFALGCDMAAPLALNVMGTVMVRSSFARCPYDCG